MKMKKTLKKDGHEETKPLFKCVHCGDALELYKHDLKHLENVSELIETYRCQGCERKYHQFWSGRCWEEDWRNKGRNTKAAPKLDKAKPNGVLVEGAEDHAELVCDLGIMLPDYVINSMNDGAMLLVKRDSLGDKKANKRLRDELEAFLDVEWED
jgi:hypothetical protein